MARVLLVWVLLLTACGERQDPKEARYESMGVVRCMEYVEGVVRNPETLQWHRWDSLSTTKVGEGEWHVETQFSAANSFNVRRRYLVRCTTAAGYVTGAQILEAR